jgi:Rrf2 family transcriptional regulator, cysteine metabolism repressor
MKFSTKAEYGLRAMTSLALDYPEVKSIQDISREEGISAKYLERLMNELRKEKLVKSYKGKSGGYMLAKNSNKIRVGEIINVLEGPLDLRGCNSGKCTSKKCLSKKVWLELEKQMKKTLQKIKLSDLIGR